jgi:hypothetical protein
MGGLAHGLWGGTLWGQGLTGLIGNPLVLDVTNSLADVWYRLGFASASDLGPTSWVTPAELYQFADDASKKVAYGAGVLITVDTSITVTSGTASYSLPTAHVFTLLAALVPASGTPQLLRLTPVRDLWALDANWPTTMGNAQRASMDAAAVGYITLYPSPIAGGTLEQVCQEYAQTLTGGASTLPLPTVLEDWFSYEMLAGARGKESEAAMPEMAAHFQSRCDLYHQIATKYWGPGQ